jgi:guanine nucleotide-binding protein G(I)/G(S)/G(T) subunit beta-1
VATGGLDNLCCIYDLSKAPQRVSAFRELSAHDGYMSCCRFVDDERQVLTSSGDSTCILWDVGRSVPKVHFNDHTGDVLTVSVSPTSPNVFVSGSSDATAKVWDMRLGKAVGTYAVHLSDVSCTAFMASGTVFATSSDDATCRLFDIRCPGQLASLQSEARVCGVPAVDFAKVRWQCGVAPALSRCSRRCRCRCAEPLRSPPSLVPSASPSLAGYCSRDTKTPASWCGTC